MSAAPASSLARYRAPWWLPGGQAQTIWPALVSRRFSGALPPYQRERWSTPDGDFIDVDFQAASDPDARWLVMFHGLEGSSHSHYAEGFAREAAAAGMHFAVPHFRGCSGEPTLAPRAYHSGDYEEVGWILARLRERSTAPLLAAGVSLGGNALLRWAQEAGHSAATTATAVAAVCTPIDLTAGGHAIVRSLDSILPKGTRSILILLVCVNRCCFPSTARKPWDSMSRVRTASNSVQLLTVNAKSMSCVPRCIGIPAP